ncbi:MAG: aspartate--tRNA ligase [Rhodospirillaceae bacterium]|nr:aspartate--tRNA ligase [Rhodospirillaceae bacterium]
MHRYRTHTCNDLRESHVGETVRLSGWVHRRRDHGQLLFVDLRDHFGITQCVIDVGSPLFAKADALRNESVVRVEGPVVARSEETINDGLATGRVEVRIADLEVLSAAETLPFPVNSDADYPEDMRLRYRFLDLRREENHRNIILRARIIDSIRRRMVDASFQEFQTPILTATSPEGARDFLVPSRLHPGKFYALPQAPQQFKQLIMCSGFDRYFQIAPCFRDEDSRADRSPGEFYQLDLEMAFVEENDVLTAVEPVLHGVYDEFSDAALTPMPWPRIPYAESMMKYGNDKPDLRNPLVIADVTEAFRGSDFKIFAGQIEKGAVVRAVPAPKAQDRPRSFFDKMNDWAREQGAPGMGWIVFEKGGGRGPIAKNLSDERLALLKKLAGVGEGDALFFACDRESGAARLAGLARDKVGQDLDLLEKDAFRFCWVVDYPMYEMDEETGRIDFSHNPFSMPQGGLEALESKEPLDVLAHQYDVVCNGVELGSGAIRNHLPDVMVKAFGIVGYGRETVESSFPALLNAFKYGAPPHGGLAPGVDRMVMQIADLPNIREGILFPMNQRAEDLLMGAPAAPDDKQLEELHIRVHLPPELRETPPAKD